MISLSQFYSKENLISCDVLHVVFPVVIVGVISLGISLVCAILFLGALEVVSDYISYLGISIFVEAFS